MIGTELGHYRLTELLGVGGMGRVYAADDLRLERRVALKLLPDELREDRSQLERFQREARLLAAMSHPNVVTVYSVEEADGRAFITMELVEGHTLLNLVRPGGLPLDELLAIARPLAEALGAAHANGIVHRDLKPANVMLSRDGRLKVVDFGIAKPERSLSTGQVPAALTGAGLILGTLAYMAPEQLRGEAIDQRADWFAYAVLIFELATGRRPFAGDNDAELVSAILRDPPLSLVQLRSDLPAQLEGILDGCFQKDRVHRTNSAHDVIRALDELRNPGASGPRPAAPPKLASLAVLPLQELGGGVEDLLADGITEALITDLARTTGLKVISRSSVARFKSSAESLQAIARRLGVDALLVGSVRRGGDRIRISVELVEPASEQVLWADRYDRELGDVLRLQDEIAKAIADGIHIRVGRAAGTTQTPLRVDPEVYLLDLKGRSQIETRTDASFHAALAHFQQALVRDPNYGPCHLGVARAYNMMANYGLVEPVQTRAQVQSAIERARENHADRAEVLGEQAQMRWQFDFDWSGAEADFQRALELAPNSARLWNWRGLALATGGRFNTGLDCLIRAEELDPLSYVIAATRGMSLYFARRIPEAVACLRSVVELSPELAPPYWLLGMALVAAGDYVGAIATYEAAIVRMGRISRILGYLGHAYGRAGREEDARTLLAELDQRALGGYVPAYFSALILAGLDAREATLTQLERSWVERDSMLRDVLVDAPWDPLREDPRFRALIASMGPPSGAAGGEPGSTTRVLSP